MFKLDLERAEDLMRRIDSLEKTDAGRDWGQEKKGTTEDEMAGWHHRLNGREFEWIPADGDGQGGLACCDSWGHKESDMPEQLYWTEEPEIKLPTSVGSSKKQESSRKTSTSALLTMPKHLIVWITTNCGKFWTRWEYKTTSPESWEICMQVKKQQLELDIEQWTGSK